MKWGQCPRLCLKGIQLITAEHTRYSARLRDMITVVSQLSQSENTQSVTADQRQSSAGKALSVHLLPPTFTLTWLRVVLVSYAYINMFRYRAQLMSYRVSIIVHERHLIEQFRINSKATLLSKLYIMGFVEEKKTLLTQARWMPDFRSVQKLFWLIQVLNPPDVLVSVQELAK